MARNPVQSVVVLAAELAGYKVIEALVSHAAAPELVVVDSEDTRGGNEQIRTVCRQAGIPVVEWESFLEDCRGHESYAGAPDLGICAWWPRILNRALLEWPGEGWINLHPSLLPHNRGKHPNFWALRDETPAGATLHFLDESIDGGDIIAQQELPVSWEDNGETVYYRTRDLCLQLFDQWLPKLLAGNIPRRRQNPKVGSTHYAKELESASEIELEKAYEARALLNLLRARTFPPHPAAYFWDDGVKYSVRVRIERVRDE